jgi:hypothetical protein
MARGIDHLNDPRWEGQDSQSLPDRPAHPDPSRRAEFGDPKETPSHGIYGFLENKHGLVSEEQLDAEAALGAQSRVEALEAERTSVQARADAGDDAAKARLKGVDAALKAAKSDAEGAPEEEQTLAAAILSGEVVPSIENASHVEGKGDGKRDDMAPGNAPPGAERK